MMGMVVSRFYTVNVVSALAWASSHILSGVLVGATFRVLGSAAKPLAILLVVLLVAGWTLLHIMRWTLRRGVHTSSTHLGGCGTGPAPMTAG